MGSRKQVEREWELEVQEPELATALPKLYKVVLLNDDYTPMDFVILILEQVFAMNEQQATQAMLQVHNGGKAVCGVFTYEIAETKVAQVNDYARRNEHPLKCALEKA